MPYLFVFFILLSAYPFAFCQFIPLPAINILGFAFFLILAGLLAWRRKLLNLPVAFNLIFFAQLFTWGFYAVYHSDSSYITRVVFLSVAYMSLLFIHNYSLKGILGFLNIYRWMILAFAIGGTITFFLALFDLLDPFFYYTNQDGRVAAFYGLTCTNAFYGTIIRYAGFFDEPGAMAYWGVFALIINRLFFHDAKYEKCLMICLAFTFSMAYYIQLCMFLLFVKNKFKALLVFAAVVISFIFCIHLTKNTDYDISALTIGRFEMNSRTGDVAGDNRSELSKLAKEQFMKAPVFGIGAIRMNEIAYMADNPYEILAKDGIVGEIVTYLPLLLIVCWGIKKRRMECLTSVLILFAGYQQRPFHVDLVHPMILYALTISVLSEIDVQNEYEDEKSIHSDGYIQCERLC